jgi:LytS/YehU family sensor histidine kinase
LESTTAHKSSLNKEQFEETLIYFASAIHTGMNEEDVLWDLAKNCISKLGFVDCVIYLVDDKCNILIQKAAYGPKNPKDYDIYQPVTIPLGKGITGSVALSGQAEIIPDTTKDSRYILDDEMRHSEICVPITANGEVLGVIDCEHPEKDFFTPQHLRMLKAIASISGIKLKQIKTEQKIKAEQEVLLRVKSQMLDLKLRAFKSQMNPHFVFNTLNAIQFFITNDEQVQALNYLSTFSKLIRYYMKNIDKETISLSEETEMLNRYLNLQKLRYDNRFDYHIRQHPASLQNDAVVPAFLMQTLLENIIEFSIFAQRKACQIHLTYKVTPGHVEVDVDFRYESPKEAIESRLPEYREQITKWQDQIRLLNLTKNYKIKKKAVFYSKQDNEVAGGNIKLTLPNLI